MSKKAWAFVLIIIGLAVVRLGFSLTSLNFTTANLTIFVILTSFAIISQIYEVEGTFRNTYYPHLVFFISGTILLEPFLFSLLVIIPHALEWLLKRLKNSTNLRAWYIQPFNMATHLLAGFVTASLYAICRQFGLIDTLAGTLIILLMAYAYTFVNHFLVGMALYTARGLSFYESGILKFGSLMPDLILGCLGYILVLIWNYQPYLLPLSIVPLVLMYQALKIPQLTQDAQVDAKTTLLTAKYFNKLVSNQFDIAVRNNTPLCLLMTDLDLMRNINNNYGHLAGDAVLAGIGRIIRQSIPDQNHAGRFGGEEFAILLTGVDLEQARRIAERIRKEVEATNFVVETNPNPIKATLSIGIAAYPQNAKNVTELSNAADIAVYQAKRTGRNRVIAYSDLSREEIQLLNRQPNVLKFKDNDELIRQLRQALDENQFELYYQPKVEMNTGLIKGVEALMRWNHPERGVISPREFMPVAEETGLILPLGNWVLEEACRQITVWNNFLRRNSPLVVSVNFSAIQFQREDMLDIISRVLENSRATPDWLEIEIAESVLMDNTVYTINILNRLKEMGVKIAMDNFGLGYSSLGYLRNFPLDSLKIDRNFVSSLDKDEINQALIQAMVTFARKLRFSIVAEGVETEQERNQLYQLGCTEGQGYLFARPMPPQAINELLNQEKNRPHNAFLSLIK